MIISLRVYDKGFIFLRTKMKKKKIEFFGNPKVLLNEKEYLNEIAKCANDYTMAYYGSKGMIKESVDINSKTGDYLNIPKATRDSIAQFSND